MTDTKKTPAPPEPKTTDDIVDPTPAGVQAVTPQGEVRRRRTDDDVLTGHFAKVIAGEHEGKTVAVLSTVSLAKDGYPKTVQAKTRDDRDELLVLDYKDLRPVPSGGR